VVRRDFEAANRILPSIPRERHTAVARFLEAQGFREEALAVSTDPDHRFDLALQLGHLNIALTIVKEADADSTEAEAKWKQLADLALARSDLALVEECALAGRDLSTLLLLYTSLGHAAKLQRLAEMARVDGRANVEVLARLATADCEGCVASLQQQGRPAEAALFARSYAPSLVSAAVAEWKAATAPPEQPEAAAAAGGGAAGGGGAWRRYRAGGTKAPATVALSAADAAATRAAEAIADPGVNPELFAHWELALRAEAAVRAGALGPQVVPGLA